MLVLSYVVIVNYREGTFKVFFGMLSASFPRGTSPHDRCPLPVNKLFSVQ